MDTNQEDYQLGQGSEIDKKQQKSFENKSQSDDDDFVSGDNKIKYHPDLDQYEVSVEEEDRYNFGAFEHDELIDNKPRYNGLSRNGSHRNHTNRL